MRTVLGNIGTVVVGLASMAVFVVGALFAFAFAMMILVSALSGEAPSWSDPVGECVSADDCDGLPWRTEEVTPPVVWQWSCPYPGEPCLQVPVLTG